MASDKRTTRISHRHALDSDELMFVRIFVAFGKQNAAEAYRRAYLAKNEEGDWFLRDKKGDPRLDKPVDANTASKKATALLVCHSKNEKPPIGLAPATFAACLQKARDQFDGGVCGWMRAASIPAPISATPP